MIYLTLLLETLGINTVLGRHFPLTEEEMDNLITLEEEYQSAAMYPLYTENKERMRAVEEAAALMYRGVEERASAFLATL